MTPLENRSTGQKIDTITGPIDGVLYTFTTEYGGARLKRARPYTKTHKKDLLRTGFIDPFKQSPCFTFDDGTRIEVTPEPCDRRNRD